MVWQENYNWLIEYKSQTFMVIADTWSVQGSENSILFKLNNECDTTAVLIPPG